MITDRPVRRMAAATLSIALLPGTATRTSVAAVPDTVLFGQLTWTGIRDRIADGTTTIILPVGGTEQSGPCIAVGKHDRRIEVPSERIARQTAAGY